VQRKNLGKWQAGRIKGVEIKTNSKVTEITKDGVVVNNSEKYSYKFLVGADGSYSAVRRYLGLKTKKSGVGLQYLVRTNRFNELEIFLDQKLFGVGYAWIFPYKESASVGCCSLTEKNLKANFEKWLDKMNINVAGAEYGAQCINLNYKGFKFGNVFLTGDAAGLASSITGEGIYEALVSGEEIAKMILDSNYIPEKLNSIIMLNKIRDVLSVIMKHSGLLRVLEFEFVHLLLRNRYIAERLFR